MVIQTMVCVLLIGLFGLAIKGGLEKANNGNKSETFFGDSISELIIFYRSLKKGKDKKTNRYLRGKS